MNEPYAVISTHTLTWSVTHGTLVQRQISNFNSHAHVERDFLACVNVLQTLNFNSHAHVERDLAQVCCTSLLSISTHTLTWSVTLTGIRETAKELNFNSHAHVERDFAKLWYYLRLAYFNSHAHVERDGNLN